jgi:hypothetical protein
VALRLHGVLLLVEDVHFLFKVFIFFLLVE